MSHHLAQTSMEWHFIPTAAPHWIIREAATCSSQKSHWRDSLYFWGTIVNTCTNWVVSEFACIYMIMILTISMYLLPYIFLQVMFWFRFLRILHPLQMASKIVGSRYKVCEKVLYGYGRKITLLFYNRGRNGKPPNLIFKRMTWFCF